MDKYLNYDIAKVAHAVHLAYCKEMGIKTQPEWQELDFTHKRTIVDSIGKIRSGEINSAEESHKNFVRKKIEDGWICGERYDKENKINPRLVSFDKLSITDRAKEVLFFECVNSFKQLKQ